ncbi:LysR substrate-binding domain-containing protein [Burkholderia multivorans]|uniref:LysR substrate-binding domain-containing protein n=1 Tax=Burkholderia multivorans TaxID=87883 RepID=UPI0012DD8C60|nr:LysR substrate-binding domain-containing protein [Burkholderia multivorans]MBU9337952.1 LysR family transcriptional regulator [Burkholderia multivorans]MCA8138736.1 LysR family transcriptional regulator [Burkholderia multivorans]MCO1363835.1 LysR substrate-binding domain-containing protein [Burkholderia multivorans]MCO1379125.1 LysR substrate-binding domain-containing protein [Burkholderia multivorans]QGR62638.1 LysR family transcriptional regulator [Burkholderia multivorans]
MRRMARHLDLALLRTFVTIADHRSMTAAGHALHLTQGAISQQVARLEALSGPLFVREHRNLLLTAAGERLLDSARRLLAMHDALLTEMTNGAVEGTVRVGAPQDLVATCVAPILKSFAQAHPQVALTLVCAASPELRRGLRQGDVDVALIETPIGASSGECLAVDRLVWVGAKGGSAYRGTPLPVSMVAQTCAFRPIVLDALRAGGRTWRTVFENGSLDATAATVRADLAVTVWLASTVPADLDILPADCGLPALPNFAINLHLPRGQRTPAATELARHLRNGFARVRTAAWQPQREARTP